MNYDPYNMAELRRVAYKVGREMAVSGIAK